MAGIGRIEENQVEFCAAGGQKREGVRPDDPGGGFQLGAAQEQYLSQVLKDRTAEKYYMALVAGEVDEPMTIEGFLTKDEAVNKVQITKEPISDESLPIKTAYRPLKTIDMSASCHKATLLEVHLITGRSHQIRAQLSSIGHPIIGDIKYGDRRINAFYKENYHVTSQLLHAHHVILPDGRYIEAALPDIWSRVGL